MTVTLWASPFVVIVAIRRERLPALRDVPAIAFCGVFWMGIYNIALNEAERRIRQLLAGCAIAFAGTVAIGTATSRPASTRAGHCCAWGRRSVMR